MTGKCQLEDLNCIKESFMTDTGDFQAFISDFIKKEIVILGPQVALAKARKVSTLTVSDNGEVTAISGDPIRVLGQLEGEYINITGEIARRVLKELVDKYPSMRELITEKIGVTSPTS